MITNKPEYYIIHHSATRDGLILRDFDAIRNYHVNVLKYRNIGYQWILEYVNGKLEWRKGREEWESGAHTINYNTRSIGLCVVGNFNTDVLTLEHYGKLREKILELDAKYGQLPIAGHGYFSNTECPGKNIDISEIVKYARTDVLIDDWKRTIQKYCKFGAPEGVWYFMDKHPYGYDLYKKWAESYKRLVKDIN